MINIDYVSVGHAENAAYNSTGSLYGAVAYAYQIGKYEVTNAQYTAFLNAADPTGANANGIYNSSMGRNARGGITYTAGAASGEKYTIRTSMGDKPVNYVSWYDSARFTNWVNNGQGACSTETGAYMLTGNTGIITKSVGAIAWLPSEEANNYFYTADHKLNVWEWNDAVISGSSRGLRGGSFRSSGSGRRASGRGNGRGPTTEVNNIGFRVASVPEPTSLVLMMLAGSVMLARRKR